MKTLREAYYKAYDNLDDMLESVQILREKCQTGIPFNLFQDKQWIRGEIELSNANPIVGYKKRGKYYIDRELIRTAK